MKNIRLRFWRLCCRIVHKLNLFAFQKEMDSTGEKSIRWQKIQKEILHGLHVKVAKRYHFLKEGG